jgi:hypothetical protein
VVTALTRQVDHFRVRHYPVRVGLLFIFGEFSELPSWRAWRGVARHKLVGHAEQVPQYIEIHAREANQHGAIADIVVRHVVNIRGRSEQLGAIIEIHADNKRSGFCRAMCGDTGQKFSMDLECRLPVRCALLHAGQRKSDIPHSVEVDCASRHWSARFL